MYKILVPKALKPVAREFLTKKGYELVSPEATDEVSLAKAIADVDAVIARTEKYTKRSSPGTALGTKTSTWPPVMSKTSQ